MGINLRDYIHEPDTFFTLEEAEKIFLEAGYRDLRLRYSGFKESIISECSNHNINKNSENIRIENGDTFTLSVPVKPNISRQINSPNISVQGESQEKLSKIILEGVA